MSRNTPVTKRPVFLFEDPRQAGADGLVAWGGRLEPDLILDLYKKSLFPWYNEGDPVLWWSPDPRLILRPSKLRMSKSFRRVLRKKNYRVVFDANFEKVITLCSTVKRSTGAGTWINAEIVKSYCKLHEMGYAHSVEVYMGTEILGGLYGLAIGGVFFGESMFSITSNMSKIALKALSDVLSERSYDFIDCQVVTGHLLRMGAEAVSRDSFIEELEESTVKEGDLGSWLHIKWEYEDGRYR